MRAARALGLAAVVLGGGVALAQPASKVTGPVATYWMNVQTQSGFAMPGAGGGGMDRGAMMRMMMGGGGGGAQHLLTLQLGSSRKPQGAPQAEHMVPQGLGVGASLPLVTPVAQPTQPVEEDHEQVPRDFQRPKGRMLIFWGCGEHARPGQPVVIDFSTLSAGQIPPGLSTLMRGLAIAQAQPPSPSRNATYGEWPNGRTRASVPSQGSLVGDHLVRGDYSPDIRFTLTPDQDFLAPLTLTTNERTPSGAVQLAWNPVGRATGYFASVVGGGQDTVVLWSSSETQGAAFVPPGYLPPSEAARLVAARGLLSPQTTRCTVPQEATQAAPHALVQLAAYGPEVNFTYPPKPSDPRAVWNREWTVKVRYRSATGGLLGMAMPGMGGGRGGDEEGEGGPPQERRRGSILRGLGGAMGVPGL